jgi:hypothetical protein
MGWNLLDHGVETVDSGMGLAALLVTLAVVLAGIVSYLLWRRAEARRLARAE